MQGTFSATTGKAGEMYREERGHLDVPYRSSTMPMHIFMVAMCTHAIKLAPRLLKHDHTTEDVRICQAALILKDPYCTP